MKNNVGVVYKQSIKSRYGICNNKAKIQNQYESKLK